MALAFDRSFEPRTGTAVPVAPGVQRVTAPNPSPFTFHGTNTFLIGADRITVLDPGPADPAHLDAVTAAIGSASVAHILLTHRHSDHSAGARLLQERTGAPILAAMPLGRGPTPRPREAPRLDAGVQADFVPDQPLADGAIVEGPGYRLEAIATPGHASDHLAYALLGRDALFSGDHVMGWSTTVVAPPDGSMAEYIASLDRLLARPEGRYLPAHGGAIGDAHAYVRALRAHRKMREAAVLAGLRRGDRTIAELVARNYPQLDARLTGAAALSTLAHLDDLVTRGLVAADGPPTLDRRYWDTTPDVTAPGRD